MKTFLPFISLVVLGLGASVSVWSAETPDEVTLTPEAKLLADMLNDYREENGLDRIPLSKSLTHVAQVHVTDLNLHYDRNTGCNVLSWSDQGDWTPCCVTDDPARLKCMWDKPKQLSSYKTMGIEMGLEIFVGRMRPSIAFHSYIDPKNNSYYVLLNKKEWGRVKYKAMGIALQGRFVAVWFGMKTDKEGEPGMPPETDPDQVLE